MRLYKKKSIKLLILAKQIDGGTGTFINHLVELKKYRLSKLDISVLVLERQKYRSSDIPLTKFKFYYTKSSYPQYYYFNLKNVSMIIEELFWVRSQIKKLRPCVIISIDTHCNLIICFLKIFFDEQYKIILTFHNNISAVVDNKLSFIFKHIIIITGFFFFWFADVIVGVSNGVSQNISRFFGLKNDVKTIHYGVKIEKSRLTVKSSDVAFYKFGLEEKVIISIGRFENQKDFKTLIRAFNIVRQKIRSVQLLLIGDGADRQKLERLVQYHGIQDSVIFLGWQENIYSYLNYSNIFILSSFYEGLPYVLLEAISQGLPVISTDAPFGPREILDNGKYGILVPMKDEKAMAEAMYTLLTDKKKYNYYSKKSLERVKFFTLDKMLDSYKKIILDLAKKQSNFF